MGSVVLLAMLLAAGCTAGRERIEALLEPDAREAEANYRRSCAPCHGLDGQGGGPVAPALGGPAPDIARLALRHDGVYPRELVIAAIVGENPVVAHGTREMPVWSVRFDRASGATAAAAFWARRRVELLADYVGTLQRPD